FRLIVIVTFIGLHASIGLTMELGNFQPLCVVSLLGLLPSQFWDGLGRRLRSPVRDGLKLYYDADNGPAKESVRFWTTWLMLADTETVPAQTDAARLEQVRKRGTWIAVEGQGKVHSGYDAILLLFRVSPLFRPVGWLLARKPFR